MYFAAFYNVFIEKRWGVCWKESPMQSLKFKIHQSSRTTLIVVPFPIVDSITKVPPESSVRSLMLVSPNPFLECS